MLVPLPAEVAWQDQPRAAVLLTAGDKDRCRDLNRAASSLDQSHVGFLGPGRLFVAVSDQSCPAIHPP